MPGLVDVSTLTQHEAHDYLHELHVALHNPGIEFNEVHNKEDVELYKAKIAEVKAHLDTFPGQVRE